MRLALGCAFFAIAACDTGPILPTAPRPGPCRSATDSDDPRSCTMSYDDADRLAAIACRYHLAYDTGYPSTDDWSYEHDGDVLVAISRNDTDGLGATGGGTVEDNDESLDLASDPITGRRRHWVDTADSLTRLSYEPELALTRHPFETESSLLLGARDALLSTHYEWEDHSSGPPPSITEHTYTYDGPPHQGTRTQTRDDGRQVTFEYDAAGRLIAASADGPTPARIYEYDGDLLVRDGALSYEHDEFGNLVRRFDGDTGITTTYDYGCWE